MKSLYRFSTLSLLVLGLAAVGGATAADTVFFAASLNGAQEVPVRPAEGSGFAFVSTDGASISYEIQVSNIRNVVAAHIHTGPPGVNGPVVLTLYSAPPGRGLFSGVLAQARNIQPVLEGPLAGQPVSALLPHLQSGNAYVNVHTNDGIDPVNTGPGDFPGGEIRGDLRPESGGGGLRAGGRRGGRTR